MAKNNKARKKMKSFPFGEGGRQWLVANIPTLLVALIFCALAFFLTKAFLYQSDYFRIRAVEVSGFGDQSVASAIAGDVLGSCKNKNVFTVGLARIAGTISARYPDARSVVVTRKLPDKLVVAARFRKPVAVIYDTKLYPVDAEGIVISSASPDAVAALPIIVGVDVSRAARASKKNEMRTNILSALSLIDELKRARVVTEWRSLTIDAGDLKSLAFRLPDGLEVRIGNENIPQRLVVLKKTLHDPRLVRDKIKYIDVRFNDVVIGPK